MLRKIVVLTLLIFFVVGTVSAMAGDKGASGDKNVLQSMYDCCSGWGKSAAKTAECCCKACGKTCCATCNMDCGGKCCSMCGKK